MKRSFLTRLVCTWLALVVLLGSSGFTVVEHLCQMRGKMQKLALTADACVTVCTKATPCPPAESGTHVQKAPCCKVIKHYRHLETNQQASQALTAPVAPVLDADLVAHAYTLLARLISPALAVSAPPASDAPLSPTGRARLAHHCTWLI